MGGVKMEITGFGERLAKLRTVKGISSRKMSYLLGRSDNYINKIENGKTYPSMSVFFDICSCLEISPKDFFDDENNYPVAVNEMINEYKRLDSAAQTHITGIVKVLQNKK